MSRKEDGYLEVTMMSSSVTVAIAKRPSHGSFIRLPSQLGLTLQKLHHALSEFLWLLANHPVSTINI